MSWTDNSMDLPVPKERLGGRGTWLTSLPQLMHEGLGLLTEGEGLQLDHG